MFPWFSVDMLAMCLVFGDVLLICCWSFADCCVFNEIVLVVWWIYVELMLMFFNWFVSMGCCWCVVGFCWFCCCFVLWFVFDLTSFLLMCCWLFLMISVFAVVAVVAVVVGLLLDVSQCFVELFMIVCWFVVHVCLWFVDELLSLLFCWFVCWFR